MMNQTELTINKKQQVFAELIISINQLVGAIKGELEIDKEEAINNLNTITFQINHLDG